MGLGLESDHRGTEAYDEQCAWLAKGSQKIGAVFQLGIL